MLADKVLVCNQCSSEFIFSVAEQEYFTKMGYLKPIRCFECRAKKRSISDTRERYPAVCTRCGKDTLVPFKLDLSRPIFCRDCYKPTWRVAVVEPSALEEISG